ncbi:MAG: hypothetical protein ABEI77_05240 [Halorientalis sp.]
MTDWETVRRRSFIAATVDTTRRRFGRAVSESRAIAHLQAVESAFGRAATTSAIGGTVRTVGRWIHSAWLYRWLTKEPDPDVIVIDLRETWTVAPILRGIDLLASTVAGLVGTSRLSELSGGLDRAVRTAPVQIIGIVLFIALLVNTLVRTQLGGLSETGLGFRLILLALATLLTRIDASYADLRDGRVGRVVKALFAPPDLPDEENERREETEADRET